MADVITKIVNGHLASKLVELMRGLITYEGGDDSLAHRDIADRGGKRTASANIANDAF